VPHPIENDRFGAASTDAWQGLQVRNPCPIGVDADRQHTRRRPTCIFTQAAGRKRSHGEAERQDRPRHQQQPLAGYQRRIWAAMRASTPWLAEACICSPPTFFSRVESIDWIAREVGHSG
jgi:hypothetical protein